MTYGGAPKTWDASDSPEDVATICRHGFLIGGGRVTDGVEAGVFLSCERAIGHDGQHQRTIGGGEAYLYWVNHGEVKKGTETP